MMTKTTMIDNMMTAPNAARLRKNRAYASCHSDRPRTSVASSGFVSISLMSTSIPDAGIEPGVKQVRDQIERDRQRAIKYRRAKQHRIVAVQR